MQDILRTLTPADFGFLIGVIGGSKERRLTALLDAVQDDDPVEARAALTDTLEHEIRYYGSADVPYMARKAFGAEPGVSFSVIIHDAARKLRVRLTPFSTEREMIAELAQETATQQFASLTSDEQQRLLEDLGIERERAVAFLKRSAGVFAVPTMIEAFGIIVVQGLVKTVIFGLIAKIVGAQLAARLFQFLVSRLPWWVGWISPAAWTLSLGWVALDIQGPAMRKTIPVVLYLGLCVLREEGESL